MSLCVNMIIIDFESWAIKWEDGKWEKGGKLVRKAIREGLDIYFYIHSMSIKHLIFD